MNNSIKAAIFSLGVYIVLGIVGTLLTLDNIETTKDIIKPISRIGMFAVGIWGLINYKKWAWWLCVCFSGLYGIVGTIAIVGLLIIGPVNGFQSIDPIYMVYLSALALSLLSAMIFLLLPSARSSFKKDQD